LLALVAAVMLPTLLASIVAILYVYKEEETGFQQALKEATRALSLVVDRELARREAIARTLSNSPTLTRADLASFYEYARAIAPTPDTAIVLHDLSGRQLVNTRVPFGAPLPPSAVIKERETAGPLATVVSSLYFAPLAQRYSFAVQVPVVREQRVIYYLSMAGYASNLQSVLQDQRLTPGWVASILDRNGVFVARSREAEKFVGQPANERVRGQPGAGNDAVFKSVSVDGTPVLASFSRSPNYGWSVVIGVPLSTLTPPLQAAATFGLLSLLLLTAGLVAAVRVGRWLADPVRRLGLASRQLGSGAPLEVQSTGLKETDEVLAALHEANQRITRATHEMEERVRHALEEAEKAHRTVIQSQRLEALGQLTGGVAHDFNNILMVVKTNLHLLRSRWPPGTDAMPLDRIGRATDTGAQLTRQLLAFARRQPLRPETIDLRTRVPDLVGLIRPALGSRVEVQCAVAEDTFPIEADPAEFELALINLGMNARDAMPEGGHLTYTVGNRPEPVRGRPAVEIAVADTGGGIEPEALARVFEPFFTTKPVGQGTGLGLSQVHGFVTQAGGEVALDSRLGQGTTVRLILPAAQVRAEASERPGQAFPSLQGGGRRVLLVEDNEEVAASTGELLRDAGYTVERVAGADEARRRLESGASYDAVLSDIRMPGAIDGIALAAWWKERQGAAPIVLMTGYSAELRQAFKLGLEVIPKPSSPETILGSLAKAMTAPEPAAQPGTGLGQEAGLVSMSGASTPS
jgi:signal transduction histidine kinase/ActR/RegA family two-component response regulator